MQSQTHAGGLSEYTLPDGRTFPFSSAYFEPLNAARPLASVPTLPVYAGENLAAHARKVEDVSFQNFLSKFYDCALLLDVLTRFRKLRRFKSSLDIGSGPGIQARSLKLAGWVEHSEGSDIYDARARCSDRRLRRFGRQQWLLYQAYRAQKKLPPAVRDGVPKLRRLNAAFPIGLSVFGYLPSDRAYGSWFSGEPGFDDYHVGDVLEHKGRYELVTSFMALEYLDFERVAGKASEWLPAGGVFAFLVAYWWYPINNTLLYGRFPFLLQQLSRDEVAQYYAHVHSELDQTGIGQRLHYSDPLQATVADYESVAWRHGLSPVAAIRLRPDPVSNSRAVLGPWAIDRLPGWGLERVLANARRVKPALSLADLLTSHVLMVFEKR